MKSADERPLKEVRDQSADVPYHIFWDGYTFGENPNWLTTLRDVFCVNAASEFCLTHGIKNCSVSMTLFIFAVMLIRWHSFLLGRRSWLDGPRWRPWREAVWLVGSYKAEWWTDIGQVAILLSNHTRTHTQTHRTAHLY